MNFNLAEVTNLIGEKLTSWYEAGVQILPNLAISIIALLFFAALARLTRHLAAKVIRRLTSSPAILNLGKTIAYILTIFVGLFVVLDLLHLEKTVTSLLAGAGVVGLALGFAFQEIASNFVSGILIALNRPYNIGDIIRVDDFFGKVLRIDLRTTSIETFQGLEVLVPNKTMFTKALTNYTTTPRRRLDLEVGVSYGDDLAKVEKIATEALENLPGRISEQNVEVYYKSFGSSSINLDLRVWIKYPGDQTYFKARHTAIKRLKEAFDKNEVTIPFPIRTLDFGIKGGQSLAKTPLKMKESTSTLSN